MLVIYLVTSLKAIGDVAAAINISRESVEGLVWMGRIEGGVLVNGANSLQAGVLSTFPSSIFAQNYGVIQLAGIASLHVGKWIALFLVLLGLFPSVAGVIQAVPEPVLGGGAIVMFGVVAAVGINILGDSTWIGARVGLRVVSNFSEDRRKQAVVCSKKSLNGSPSEFVSNSSCSEVRMAQATTLQPGQIRHLFWSVVNN